MITVLYCMLYCPCIRLIMNMKKITVKLQAQHTWTFNMYLRKMYYVWVYNRSIETKEIYRGIYTIEEMYHYQS